MNNLSNKLRGGYYTPEPICRFLCCWAIQDQSDTVLEPSCGDGAFLRNIGKRLVNLGADQTNIHDQVLGIELEPDEAGKARACGSTVVNSDFFEYYNDHIDGKQKFDVALLNPPYVRSQIIPEKSRKTSFDLMGKYGFHPNRLTNLWVPFVVLSSLALTDTGRIGMVIPAELMTVKYAAETRKFLTEHFERLTLITFRELMFEGIEQEVILLLGEMKADTHGMRFIELNGLDDLEGLRLDQINATEYPKDDKWTICLLTEEEQEVLNRLADCEGVTQLSDIATINVGLVTGKNEYFILSHKDVQKHRLERDVLPVIVRTSLIKGSVLREEDFQKLDRSGAKIYLFSPKPRRDGTISQHAKDYIAHGEEQGFDKPYKCRIRNPWYKVPITWTADAFLPSHANAYPRMILNPEGVLCSDNLVKFKFREGVDARAVTAAFVNSYTLALSEILGRTYGGGVLEIMPGEMRKLRIPLIGAEKLNLNLIDSWQREGKVDTILNYTDSILLNQGLELTWHEITILRGIWIKLRDRRMGRKKKETHTQKSSIF